MSSRALYTTSVIGLWMLWSILFILRSPNGAFSHDIQGHLQHTRILFNEHRLALPHEGSESYGPPLYYALNALLAPNHRAHITYVRLMSVLFGALSLGLMMEILGRYRLPAGVSALVVSFLATTPAFLFMFTTYNNDALATVLSIGILAATDDWIRHGKQKTLIVLGILTVAGLYTKLSTLFTLGALGTWLAVLAASKKVAWKQLIPMARVLLVSLLLLTPWLVGHNYRLTGELTPSPADRPVTDEIRLPQSPLRTLLTPPGWTRGEWKDPYVHVWDADHHKKNSFWAYVFVTSIFGEFSFEFLPPAIPWAILILHACVWAAVLFRVQTSPDGLAALGLVFLGSLFMTALLFRSSYYAALMDFRYIAWTWLPTALLYGTCLEWTSPLSFSGTRLLRATLMSGTVLHGLLWLGLILGGRWNIPG